MVSLFGWLIVILFFAAVFGAAFASAWQVALFFVVAGYAIPTIMGKYSGSMWLGGIASAVGNGATFWFFLETLNPRTEGGGVVLMFVMPLAMFAATCATLEVLDLEAER